MDELPGTPEPEKPANLFEAHASLPTQPLPLPDHFGDLTGALAGQVLSPDEGNAPGTVKLTVSRSSHKGPLPAAAEFKGYKDAHPPAADWILAEATKSADHFRKTEAIGAKVASRDALLFRLLPFGIVLAF